MIFTEMMVTCENVPLDTKVSFATVFYTERTFELNIISLVLAEANTKVEY